VTDAIDEIVRCSGQHFDPQIVDAFVLKVPEMTAVQLQFIDLV
jgi:response regulator RpfG family c-di-GMP phosphodiesterase